jgi:hypothetical protein
VELLFDRGEEAVEVDVQEAEAVWEGGEGHRRILTGIVFAFYLPSRLAFPRLQ